MSDWYQNIRRNENQRVVSYRSGLEPIGYFDNYKIVVVNEFQKIPDTTEPMAIPVNYAHAMDYENFDILWNDCLQNEFSHLLTKGNKGDRLFLNGKIPFKRIIVQRKH